MHEDFFHLPVRILLPFLAVAFTHSGTQLCKRSQAEGACRENWCEIQLRIYQISSTLSRECHWFPGIQGKNSRTKFVHTFSEGIVNIGSTSLTFRRVGASHSEPFVHIFVGLVTLINIAEVCNREACGRIKIIDLLFSEDACYGPSPGGHSLPLDHGLPFQS